MTGASLFGTSFLIFWLAGPQYGAFVAGETKRPQRTAVLSIIGAQLVMIVLFLLVGAAAFSTFGVDFSSAVNFLSGKGANPLPTSQVTFLDLAVPIFGNPVIVAIVFTIIGVGAYLVGSNACLGASRKIFAWSFDRLLPAKFCEVSPRFKTPVYAAILVSIIAEIFNYLIIYDVGVYNIITGFGVVYSAVIWGVSALSAVALPFKKELFDQAPDYVRKKILGIPVLSIIGAVAFVTIVGLLIFGQLVPTIQGGLDPNAATWTFGIFFGGLVYYYLVKWYRRRNGIDLSLVYKQIPPE
jgi:APA family basic amino acid/polyamine antiporter